VAEIDHHPGQRVTTARRIIVGVSAGIAAYKAAELVRLLTASHREVRVVMTPAATEFVGETTFAALSGQPVRTQLFDPAAEAAMSHIELARWADAIVVAPATADLIARAAAGHANDLLTTLLVATPAPVFLAPAMNQQMWRAPAVARNVARLVADGVTMLGPDDGAQACGDVGPGRMLEPARIVEAMLGGVRTAGSLTGLSVLVSAGPTEEPIDPVRFVSNRSSGRMGYAVAAPAPAAGAEVTLISGPVAIAPPHGVTVVSVRTAAEMYDAVLAHVPAHDIYVGAAAIADYAPVPAREKLKKSDSNLTLDLAPTRDVIRAVAAHQARPFTVGFAAETSDLETYAQGKLKDKGLDMVAANLVGDDRAFGRDDNALVVFTGDARHDLGAGPKVALAERLVTLIAREFDRQAPGSRATESPAATATDD